MLSTLQDEVSSEEEREAQEYDGGLELVIPFLTFLKEMPGFIFFAVNSTPLFMLEMYTFTGCWFLYAHLPRCRIKYTRELFLQMCKNGWCYVKNDRGHQL